MKGKYLRLKRHSESIHINKNKYKEKTGLDLKDAVMDNKLVYYLLSALQSKNELSDEPQKTMRIDIRDYPKNYTRKQYRETVANKLMSAQSTIIKKKTIEYFNIIDNAKLCLDDSLSIDITFTDSAVNIVRDIDGEKTFTILFLQHMSECKTHGELALYCLISKWKTSKHLNFETTMENLRKMMGKGSNANRMTREIEKALPKVNKLLGLNMDFERIYKDNNNKTIHKLEFYNKQ